MKLQQAFTDFIFATNTDGSGKAASYVRALDMLGPILTEYDIVAFPEMRESYERRKAELFALKDKFNKDTSFAECPLDYLIYHRLIHGKRNIAVHEVEQTYSDPWIFLGPVGSFDPGDIDLPMDNIDHWGDWDCRDWLKFREDAAALPESFGSKFYIKDDLRRAMRRSDTINMPKIVTSYNDNFHDHFLVFSGKELQ